MDEILKIIIKCNKERKLIGPNEIKRICKIVLKNNKYDFVKNIMVFSVNPKDKNCGGLYYDDKMMFFYEGIIDIITEYTNHFTERYKISASSIDIFNYYILTIIFHEIAHARQQYIANSKYDSFEKKLFGLFLDLSHNRDFYKANYDNILTEINANNVAYVTSNYLYSKLPFNFFTNEDKVAFQLNTMKLMLYNNYEISSKSEMVVSPAERIAMNFDKDILESVNMNIEQYGKLIYKKNFTLYKKLMLGLPISYIEYAYANLLIDTLEADEEINAIKKIQKRIK